MQTEKKIKKDLEKSLFRHERYLKKKHSDIEKKNGIIYCGNDEDHSFSQAAFQFWQQSEQEKKSCQALYQALEDLREIDPVGYRMIVEYYLVGKVTLTDIGKKHRVSRQACGKRIKKCLSILKRLVQLHINE